jgi:hypothetical protein
MVYVPTLGSFEFDDKLATQLDAAIPMMKAAEPGTGDHGGPRRRLVFHGAAMGRVLPEGIMNPVVVVIVHVITNQPAEMFFIQRDDMVQDCPAAASDPAFCDSILPRRPHARPLRLQARCLQESDYRGPGSHSDKGKPRETLRAVVGPPNQKSDRGKITTRCYRQPEIQV